MSVAQEIKSRLETTLAARSVEVKDESHLHAGHAGSRPGGETHFRVQIVSDAFEGQSRVLRHRLVTDALKDLMDNPIHALSVKAKTPTEADK